MECCGNGNCLLPNYYGYNCKLHCHYRCKPLRCPNYLICEQTFPLWVANCHNGTCSNCAIMNFKLKFKEDIECSICLETKIGVCNFNCEHYICIDCFKRCNYGDDDLENEPLFPYGKEIEDEYDDNPDDPIWDNDENIMRFNEEWNMWDDKRILEREKEVYLRKCPICRC